MNHIPNLENFSYFPAVKAGLGGHADGAENGKIYNLFKQSTLIPSIA